MSRKIPSSFFLPQIQTSTVTPAIAFCPYTMTPQNNKRRGSLNQSGANKTSRSSVSSSSHINDVQNTHQKNKSGEGATKKFAGSCDEKQLLSSAVESSSPEVRPRSYQREMYEESLKRNIIVAVGARPCICLFKNNLRIGRWIRAPVKPMCKPLLYLDGGTLWTRAIMRMKYELNRMSKPKFIWFLAPTISLCGQQCDYIKSQIPSVETKFLSGADNVDRWTEQSHWNDILKNVSIVVSTYQILLDALIHGFVKLQSLALLVFDEAHNCVKKNPGARIMNLFYHPQKALLKDVPHILGLTASPVMGSNIKSLVKIEETLNCLSRTPTQNRSELRQQVQLPSLENIFYDDDSLGSSIPRSLKSLLNMFADFDIRNDPYYLSLIEQTDSRSQRMLHKLLLDEKTWCYKQISTFNLTANTIFEELGSWAANFYISTVVSRIAKSPEDKKDSDKLWGENIEDREKKYLIKLFQRIEVAPPDQYLTAENVPIISEKVAKVIEVLLRQTYDFSGIIFVQERAVVTTLAHLLRAHPLTRDRFKIGTMVGLSKHRSRNNIIESIDSDAQKDSLSDFKNGRTNLLIGTSVLEEGIDIPACNLVLCFQKPPNLKSYVQRRGRARQQKSKLIILFPTGSDNLHRLRELEDEMKAVYEDQSRTLGEHPMLEEEEEEASRQKRIFRVEKTGAILDLENALSHLYHFCATLPADKYVDTRPDFIPSEEANGMIRTKVILPTSVNESVRTTESLTVWKNERNSIKDAAFEAYIKLYKAGLVSDNLLPLMRYSSLDDEVKSPVEVRPSIIKVNKLMNPWMDLATAWSQSPEIAYQATISFNGSDIEMFTPLPLPEIPPFQIYWDSDTELKISIVTSTAKRKLTPRTMAQINEDTDALLQAAFNDPTRDEREHVIKFKTKKPEAIRSKLRQREAVPEDINTSQTPRLIRDHQGTPYIFRELLKQKPDINDLQKPTGEFVHAPNDVAYLSLSRLSRRRDFLNRPKGEIKPTSSKPHFTALPITRCKIDVLPFKYVQFSLMIPSIMWRLELHLIAEHLCKSLLSNVHLSDTNLVLMAICAGSSGEPVNYQRLEFLGDSVLKFCAAIEIMAAHPLWHEGNLSFRKDHLVANSRLARAAVDLGLDKYIITEKFANKKWHPVFTEDALQVPEDNQREMSTKVLADVVESLVGAAMLEGGIPKALSCLQIFLPEIKWESLEHCRQLIYDEATSTSLPVGIAPIQTILGYTFKKPSLLVEASTHASYPSGTYSLERLEFIGDSILDHVIVQNMYPYNLSHIRMHELRTALVNADILAIISMELHYNREIIDLEITPEKSSCQRKRRYEKVPLYCFLRHNSSGISSAQDVTAQYYKENRVEIQKFINSGTFYPWTVLCGVKAEKFFSDMVEALLGAIWIDSGSYAAVECVVEKMGILKLLRRVIAENVDVEHPKIKLGKLADTKKVEYVIEPATDKSQQTCSVFVGGERVVTVSEGQSRFEIETRAADEAVKILKILKIKENQTRESAVENEQDETQRDMDDETRVKSLHDPMANHVNNGLIEIDLIQFDD